MKVIKDLNIVIDKEKVFEVMSLTKDSLAYKETNRLYKELEEGLRTSISAKIIYTFSDKLQEKIVEKYDNSDKGLYVITTLGQGIVDEIDTYFKENQYLKGFLANTMADAMLFKLTETSQQYIYDFAQKHFFNLTQKLSPGDNIALKFQKSILKKIDPVGNLNIKLTEGYMLNPQKSSGWMYGVYLNQPLDIKNQHLCHECQDKNCLWRELS